MKNYREIFNYIIFGVLTTAVNLSVFYFFSEVGFDFKISTTIAWFLSVLFSFITNRRYVFKSNKSRSNSTFKEFNQFFVLRILSYIIDLVSMILLVNYLSMNILISKVITNLIVIVLNYVISKKVIFK
ncbi:GtrA family protein [Paenibacillus sp. FSL H7-0714]|uniref:GtrA family protein n=1 Tax=Paenibacillus sp. FSL H7-0714 TaxID=2954735 RepID=UPI0030F91A1F